MPGTSRHEDHHNYWNDKSITSSFSTVASFINRMSSWTSKLKSGPVGKGRKKKSIHRIQDIQISFQNEKTNPWNLHMYFQLNTYHFCPWLWSQWSHRNCDAVKRNFIIIQNQFISRTVDEQEALCETVNSIYSHGEWSDPLWCTSAVPLQLIWSKETQKSYICFNCLCSRRTFPRLTPSVLDISADIASYLNINVMKWHWDNSESIYVHGQMMSSEQLSWKQLIKQLSFTLAHWNLSSRFLVPFVRSSEWYCPSSSE